MQEQWKSVIGYEGLYEVSNTGRVRTIARGGVQYGFTIMKQRTSNKGYYYITLTKKGKKTGVVVNQLVAKAFLPNPENKFCAHHKDNNPLNNSIDNLEWATKKENYWHSKRQNRHTSGNRHGMAKITEEQARMVKDFKPTKEKQIRHLCWELGIKPGTASMIRAGRLWKHL